MTSNVAPIPAGYHTLTLYRIVNGAAAAIDFYKQAFGVQNQFYGDRTGRVEDPCGHKGYIATHIEDLTPEATHKRVEAMFGGKK